VRFGAPENKWRRDAPCASEDNAQLGKYRQKIKIGKGFPCLVLAAFGALVIAVAAGFAGTL
jgi:hypothetical protein